MSTSKQGEKNVLKLFRFAAKTVPAYQNFLHEKGIEATSIKSIRDFKNLPIADKDSYLRRYPYLDLFPNRDISTATTIAATSGSTGEPFYFPRGEAQDVQYEYIAEQFLKNQFGINRKMSVLCVIGFGMGIWIGGIFTYKSFNKLASKGYKLSIIPVGPNKKLYLKSFQKFAPFYDQIILMGYPPFIKDILDEGLAEGIEWKNYPIRIVCAAEGFSEKFREYLIKKAGLKNPLLNIVNIYGTVELGTMAYENSLCYLIRKIAYANDAVFRELFPDAIQIPTLAQYHPSFVYFEEKDGEVLGSGMGSSIPLVRYRFYDRGGVISFDEMVKKIESMGIDIEKKIREANIARSITKLPFVYTYGRSDFAVSLSGANIHPGEIEVVLQETVFENALTGKFTMLIEHDESQNPHLTINVELKRGVQKSEELTISIQKEVTQRLLRENSEYKVIYEALTERAVPRIILWEYEHPLHFGAGGKQKWIKK